MKVQDILEEVPCNLCGTNNYTIVYESRYENQTAEDLKEKFKSSGDETLIDQVVQCQNCGLIYTNPRIKADLILKGYSEGSDETFASQAAARERTFERCLNTIEKSTNKKRGKILDVGTATGSFLSIAKKRGWDVEGLEPNTWLCAWAKEHYGLSIKSRTIFEQHYPAETFDVITLWDVLEHVPDPKKVLQECNRILKKDGFLVVNYPDIGSWIARLMGRKWVFLLSVHLYYFTPDTMRKMLGKNGFSLILKKPHFQSLEQGYLMLRMKAYSHILHTIGYNTTKVLGLEKCQIPYWLGQTLVIAKKQEETKEKRERKEGKNDKSNAD